MTPTYIPGASKDFGTSLKSDSQINHCRSFCFHFSEQPIIKHFAVGVCLCPWSEIRSHMENKPEQKSY